MKRKLIKIIKSKGEMMKSTFLIINIKKFERKRKIGKIKIKNRKRIIKITKIKKLIKIEI